MRRFSADYLERTREGMWADRSALADLRLAQCDSVLDVGCGSGELTRVLVDECPGRVIGADRDPDLLAHVDAETVRADALSLPFADDSVDCVVCQALLINLPDPEAAVREFARVARERIAAVEPDNAAVTVESSVDDEADLAAQARARYLNGVETDVALGANAADYFRSVGLSDVSVRGHDQELTVEPPYSDADLETASRKANGAALRDRRDTLAGSEEELDALRAAWRAMGRDVVRQVRDGAYRRREVVPFYVTVGEVPGRRS